MSKSEVLVHHKHFSIGIHPDSSSKRAVVMLYFPEVGMEEHQALHFGTNTHAASEEALGAQDKFSKAKAKTVSNDNGDDSTGDEVADLLTPEGSTSQSNGRTSSRTDDALPAALPEPPKGSTLLEVLPFLCRLAAADTYLFMRLAGAMALLTVAKLAGIAAPVLFKQAVDGMSAWQNSGAIVGSAAAVQGSQAVALALIAGGACKALSTVLNDMRTILYTPVAQTAGRRVALNVFRHVLNLDLKFHLESQTGQLSHIIDRGTRSVTMIFRAVVFTFLPTFVELFL
eukprot:gene11492-13585_t